MRSFLLMILVLGVIALVSIGCGKGDGQFWLAELRVVQGIQQTGSKRIAGADAIDDVADFVGPILATLGEGREMALAGRGVVKHRSPGVVIG